MTIRDVQHHPASTLNTDPSHETTSNITNAVLEESYPVLPRRDPDQDPPEQPGHQPCCPYRGRRRPRRSQARAGDLGPRHRGVGVWAHVCADLADRGVRDVLIVCCDGLTGLPEATWPDSMIQTCVVHLTRTAPRFVAYQDRRKVAATLKPIYTAPKEKATRKAVVEFETSQLGTTYPRQWRPGRTHEIGSFRLSSSHPCCRKSSTQPTRSNH